MHTTDIYPSAQAGFRLPKVSFVKKILPVLVLAYVCSQLTVTQFLLLTLVAAMVMLVVNQVTNMKSLDVNHGRKISEQSNFTDGGAFSHKQLSPTRASARAVVRDGGSFEHSPFIHH